MVMLLHLFGARWCSKLVHSALSKPAAPQPMKGFTMTEQDKQTEMIASAIRAQMAHLARVHEIPPPLILAVAHAEIMSLIAATYGGDIAADCAERAAKRVGGFPSFSENELAGMAAQGRA